MPLPDDISFGFNLNAFMDILLKINMRPMRV